MNANAFALLDGDDEDVESKYAAPKARPNDKAAQPAKATQAKAPARPALVGGSGAGPSGAGSSSTALVNGGAPQRRDNNNVGNRNLANNRRPDFNDREAFRKSFQKVSIEPNGTVVLRLHETDIVKVWPNGDVILNTGTWFTAKTMASMNDALSHFDMYVEIVSPPVTKGDWKVFDGHGKYYRFRDNMKVPAGDDADRGRAAKLLEVYEMAVPAFLRPRPVQQQVPPAQHAAQQQHPAAIGAAAGLATGPRGPPPAAPRPWAAVATPPVAVQPPYGLAAQMRPAMMAPPTDFHAPTNAAAAPHAHAAAHAAHVEAVTQQLAHLEARVGQHLEGVPDEDICLVCMEELRTVVLVPCGHLVLCGGCFNDILMTKPPKERLCPMCRDEVKDHMFTD